MGERIEREIERACSQSLELRVRPHQGGIGVDLESQGPLGALFDRRREFSAEPVAEVALVDRAARKLMDILSVRAACALRMLGAAKDKAAPPTKARLESMTILPSVFCVPRRSL